MPTAAKSPIALKGAENWINACGPAPVGPGDARFLALDAAFPYYVAAFDPDVRTSPDFQMRHPQ